MTRGRKIRTPKARKAFLDALRDGLSISAACTMGGFGTSSAYEWRSADDDFAAEWDAAIETGTDVLEDEARRRALQQSDTLLIFLLKGRRPEKYKDRVQQDTLHSGDITIKVEYGDSGS